MIITLHIGIAGIMQQEEFQLADGEAKELSDNVKQVLRHYTDHIPDIAPELVDWTGLIMCMAQIYTPRLAAIRMNRKMAEDKAAEDAANRARAAQAASRGNIHPMPTAFSGPAQG